MVQNKIRSLGSSLDIARAHTLIGPGARKSPPTNPFKGLKSPQWAKNWSIWFPLMILNGRVNASFTVSWFVSTLCRPFFYRKGGYLCGQTLPMCLYPLSWHFCHFSLHLSIYFSLFKWRLSNTLRQSLISSSLSFIVSAEQIGLNVLDYFHLFYLFCRLKLGKSCPLFHLLA